MSDPPGTRWLKGAKQDQPAPPQQQSAGGLLGGWLQRGVSALGDFIRQQTAISEQQGVWTGGPWWEGGHPTGKGVADVARQYFMGLGTDEPTDPNRFIGHLKSKLAEINDRALDTRMFGQRQRTPEYEKYRQELDGRRSLWSAVALRRGTLQHIQEEMRQPDVSPRRMERLQRINDKLQKEIVGAHEAAKHFGVDPDADFPKDEFPWEQQYLPQ